MNAPILTPRCDGDTCPKCRQKFEIGNRVAPVYIVTKVGRLPEGGPRGVYLSEEFEIGHHRCEDPSLVGKLITGG